MLRWTDGSRSVCGQSPDGEGSTVSMASGPGPELPPTRPGAETQSVGRKAAESASRLNAWQFALQVKK